MGNFLRQLFSESSGVSMMRIMSFLALTAGIGIAFYGMTKLPVDYSGIALLTSVFLSAAFGGKVLQKRIEADGSKNETEVSTRSETVTAVSKLKEDKKVIKVDNPD